VVDFKRVTVPATFKVVIELTRDETNELLYMVTASSHPKSSEFAVVLRKLLN
jgi:hypothetical protein